MRLLKLFNKLDVTDELKEIFEGCVKQMEELGLKYDFSSFVYLLEKENVSLEQCASCWFGGNEEHEFRQDIMLATRYLLEAGFYDKNKNNLKDAREKAVAALQKWMSGGNEVSLLHVLLTYLLKESGFFQKSLLIPMDIIMEESRRQASQEWIKEQLTQ